LDLFTTYLETLADRPDIQLFSAQLQQAAANTPALILDAFQCAQPGQFEHSADFLQF
jgi:hypothetical protein